jgi:hypothetical protein
MNISLYFIESVDEIIPNLFISNAVHARNINNKYDLIVNCTNGIPDPPQGTFKKFIRIPINDNKNQSVVLVSYLPSVVQEIHKTLVLGGKVLVHCRMGISRSCTVVGCYLLKFHNFKNVESVMNFIKSKRSISFYNFQFISVMNEWNQICNNK